MQASILVAALLVGGSVAHADPPASGFDLVVGVGFPAGGAGLGYHAGRAEVLVEAEGMILGPGVGGTATLASNLDLVQRPRYDGTDAYLGGGVVAGFRLRGREGSISHAFEVGVFDGHCMAASCMDGSGFVAINLAYRVYFHH